MAHAMSPLTRVQAASAWMLAACGFWLTALGLYFIFFRPPLLPEDLRFMNASLAQVRAALPDLEGWLHRVFIVMGGFMSGAGVLTVFVARVGMPSRSRGTSRVIALSGLLTVALMSATNFSLHSDFRWLLLLPPLTWLAGFIAYVGRPWANGA
jgi:hypothetical protein